MRLPRTVRTVRTNAHSARVATGKAIWSYKYLSDTCKQFAPAATAVQKVFDAEAEVEAAKKSLRTLHETHGIGPHIGPVQQMVAMASTYVTDREERVQAELQATYSALEQVAFVDSGLTAAMPQGTARIGAAGAEGSFSASLSGKPESEWPNAVPCAPAFRTRERPNVVSLLARRADHKIERNRTIAQIRSGARSTRSSTRRSWARSAWN